MSRMGIQHGRAHVTMPEPSLHRQYTVVVFDPMRASRLPWSVVARKFLWLLRPRSLLDVLLQKLICLYDATLTSGTVGHLADEGGGQIRSSVGAYFRAFLESRLVV